MTDYPFEGLREATTRRRRFQTDSGLPASHRARRSNPGMKEDWLQRDLQLFALPYGAGADDGFAIAVEPNDPNITTLITNALPARTYHHGGLSEAFRDYLRSALWFLVEGDLYLEITYYLAPEVTSERPVAFRLDFLVPEAISRRFGRYRHLAPDNSDGGERVGWAPIDRRRLVVGSLPRPLRDDLNTTLDLLRASDDDFSVLAAFTTGSHGANSGFDFSGYQREVHDIVLAGSRKVGWAGRGSFTEGLLDPEKAWRAIQFARFVAQVRDAALATLQAAIDRAGEEIGFVAKLALSGVLTAEDLDEYEHDLEKGTRPMSELFSPKPRAGT